MYHIVLQEPVLAAKFFTASKDDSGVFNIVKTSKVVAMLSTTNCQGSSYYTLSDDATPLLSFWIWSVTPDPRRKESNHVLMQDIVVPSYQVTHRACYGFQGRKSRVPQQVDPLKHHYLTHDVIYLHKKLGMAQIAVIEAPLLPSNAAFHHQLIVVFFFRSVSGRTIIIFNYSQYECQVARSF